MAKKPVLLFLLLICAASPLCAEQTRQYFSVSSGTGFFVSNMGYVITNAHVVRGCDKVYLRGNNVNNMLAEVRALDEAHDLALIYSTNQPPQTAPLRYNIKDLKKGDKVVVMGYPGEAAITGNYKVVESQLVDITGPKEHPEWIQFSDAAQHGNSGGPLLDDSGNVIGVVVAKGQTYEINKTTGEKRLIGNADEAISLATVESFLDEHGVYYRNLDSNMQLDNSRVEQLARDFIVNVQCRKSVTEEEAEAMKKSGNQETTDTASNGMRVINMPQ